jgi:hypothetical protein
MATKSDFTADEWQTLQWAVLDTMALVALADPGFWDSFKEASAAARFIAAAKADSPSILVRDLAGDVRTKRDKEASRNPSTFGDEVAARVSAAASLVAEKDATDLGAFKEFVLGIADATAEAVEQVGPTEAAAIEKVRSALG